ncbi:phage baseplate assembly protein V [Sorangium sp. So ce542]|uniref:phage baseplate assembly protein V n=1 Tax=Sorangium sp. So ce542 TaxID=3133316 RepID=UPI003F5EF3DA
MSTALFEGIARIARHESRARLIAGVGEVVDVFPADSAQADHAVSVEMRDSRLVLPRVPVAVGMLGLVSLPAVGELVVVLFLDGDAGAPVVVGRLYHPDQNPPEHAQGEIALALPSPSDEPKLSLKVVGDAPSIKLELAGDVRIEIVEETARISVGADNEMQVTVDGRGGGRAEIAAGSAKITIKKDGDITISTGGNLKLEGAEVEISGSSKVKIAAPQVEIN